MATKLVELAELIVTVPVTAVSFKNDLGLVAVASSGSASDLTTGTVAVARLPGFTPTTAGIVTASGGGTTNFLRADGTWAVPAGGGTIGGSATINQIAYGSGANAITSSANLTWDGSLLTALGPGGTSNPWWQMKLGSTVGGASGGNFYGVQVDKNGFETIFFGISKDTVTDDVPANSAFFTTYTPTGTITIGRGGSNARPSFADIKIAGTGAVTLGRTTLTIPSNAAASTWPSTNVAGMLTNDGSGGLSWTTPPTSTFSGSLGTTQVAFGSGTNAIAGSADLTFTSGNLTFPRGTLTQATATSGSPTAFTVTGAPHTSLANAEAVDVYLNLTRTVQFVSGALTNQRAVLISAPTYSASASKTINVAATLAITGAPIAGSNVTLTRTYSLLVQGGTAGLAASFASAASLNMPLGSAPTTPVAGDQWATTAGFFGAMSSTLTSGPWTGVTIAATAPATSTSGNQLWWDSTYGQLYVLYDDGDSAQWVAASPGAGPLGVQSFNGRTGVVVPQAGDYSGLDNAFSVAQTFSAGINASNMPGRNKVINGGMVIDQRNSGATVNAATAFPVDRFYSFRVGGSATYTAQRSISAPLGFSNSLLYTVGTGAAPGATDYSIIDHRIEGYNIVGLAWGTASAKAVTLSFWVRSSVTGTFGLSVRNSAATRSYLATYVINSANTWEYKTIAVPGETSGVWASDSTLGLQFSFGLGLGSSYNNTASGSWYSGNYLGVTGATSLITTSGATFYLTGVQLEVGTIATPFEWRSYATELAMCQRYYERQGFGNVAEIGYRAYTSAGETPYVPMQFKATKRTTPSMVKVGTWQAVNCSQPIIQGPGSTGYTLYATVTSLGSFSFYTTDATCGITADAEL